MLLDVALLRSLNIRVVLVHGAAEQIRALAGAQRVQASDPEGTGITDAQTLELALTAANRLTHELLEGLSANDLRAACPNVVISHPVGIIQVSITCSPAASTASTSSSWSRYSARAPSPSCRRSDSTATVRPTG